MLAQIVEYTLSRANELKESKLEEWTNEILEYRSYGFSDGHVGGNPDCVRKDHE